MGSKNCSYMSLLASMIESRHSVPHPVLALFLCSCFAPQIDRYYYYYYYYSYLILISRVLSNARQLSIPYPHESVSTFLPRK